MDTICAQVTDSAIEEVLEGVPKDMNATYEGILNTIDKKPQEQRDLARRTLICVAYSRLPIPITLLPYAISIMDVTQTLEALESSAPSKAAILDACANLIYIESNTQTVRFAHFSVQEFLTSHPRNLENLDIGYEAGHREIARMSITMLSILYAQSQDTVIEKYHKYLNILNQWPHHLLAGNLSSLPRDHQMITLTSLFFEKSPPVFAMYSERSMKAVYFSFLPSVLTLIFNLPDPQPLKRAPLEKKQLLSVHGIEQFMVIFDDYLAMHYTTCVLNSIPGSQRLYSHGYPMDYSYDSPYKLSNIFQHSTPSSNSTETPEICEYSPLYSVSNEKMAKFLLDNGASVEPQTISGEFVDPLVFFVRKGNTRVTQRLLDRIVDKHGRRYAEALDAVIGDGTKIDVIQLLLNKGTSPHTQCEIYGNSLQTAAYYGNVEAMQLLLAKGVSVNVQGGEYGNPLQAAAYRGQVDAMRLLLKKGVSVHAQGGEYGNALQAAAYMNQAKAMRLLLEKGADVNAQGGYYGSALQAAAYNGNIHAMQLLLDNEAKVDTQSGYYGNALQAAASWGQFDQVEAMQLLLDKGADVNAQGGKYGNALQAAAYRGKSRAMQLLIDKGADVNAQGGEYGNALRAAIEGGQVEAVLFLQNKGGKIGD